MIGDQLSQSFVNQSSFFDKLMMIEQPQSLVPQDLKYGSQVESSCGGKQQPQIQMGMIYNCLTLDQVSGCQQQSSQSIQNIEEFLNKLKRDLEQDGKIVINGQTFELPPKDDSFNKHQYQHQASSVGSLTTLPSFGARHEEVKSAAMQAQQDAVSDKKEDEAQTTKGVKAFNFNMLNMKQIESNLQLELDDLLIIHDLNDDNFDSFTPMPKQESSFITPQPPEEIKEEKLQQVDNTQQPKKESQNTNDTEGSKDKPLENQVIDQPPIKQDSLGPKGKSDLKDNHCQVLLKRHNSEQPIMSQFIVSLSHNRQNNQQVVLHADNQVVIEQLQRQLQEKTKEVTILKQQVNKISSCLAKIYKSPQLLEKDIDDKEIIKILSQGFHGSGKLHLAFLFSSPLIYKVRDEQTGELRTKNIQQIDYQKEFDGVIESLKETGNYIRYRKIPATLDSLRKSLTENPIALHFSGHGIENNKKNFGRDSINLRDEGNFLIFEDSEGCAQFMSEKKLHELLEASGSKLEFVFVASCYSQFAGEIFHNAGAKHVICVRKGFQISDEASILFSKFFYHALFSQTLTVCQAFDIAKATLKAEKAKNLAEESKKFVLLRDSDECGRSLPFNSGMAITHSQLIPKKHKCSVFGPLIKGQIENAGSEPMFRLETSKVEDFVGRRREMQEIITEIFQNRFVTIKGMPGIGKTTIAKAIIHYLDERQAFKEGIILLSLRGLDQANMLLTRLQLIISKHLPKELKEEKAIETFQQIQERIITFMKDKEILLCLDNAEDTLRKEGFLFREILQNLLVQCPKIKILLTSRYPIGQFADISEKIYVLKELLPEYAIELLMKKAMRPISEKEIQDLINNANPSRVLNSNPVDSKKNIKRLDEHHLSTLLGGHPHAISLAAPLLQDKSLKELYTLLNSPDIIKWLQIEGIEGTPIASLKVSLDTSIEHMTEQEPMAIKLFCLIGLFPGGCTEEDLNYLWNDGWVIFAEKLMRASLLVKKTGSSNEVRYTLFPFMNQYAIQLMDEESKLKEHKNICTYLAKICKDLLRLTTQEIINRLVSFETNIWACIYRILDRHQNSTNDQLTRGKSPGCLRQSHSMMRSQIEGNEMVTSQDDSSHGGQSSERIDPSQEDYYESILYQRREDRSRSEKTITKRSLMNENNHDHSSVDQDEETKTQKSSNSQNNNGDQLQEDQEGKIPQGSQKKKQTYTQPQSLTQSQYEAFSQEKEINITSESGSDSENLAAHRPVKKQVSDDQLSLLLCNNSQMDKIKKKLQIITSQDPLAHSCIEDNDNQSLSNEVSESIGLIRSDSNDTSTPSSKQTSQSFRKHNKHPQELSYQKLQSLPYSKNHIMKNFGYHNIEDDNQSMIQFNDQVETSSIDSLQHQLLNMTYTTNYCDTSQQPYSRRKSAYNNAKQLFQLDEIDETLDENDSCIMLEDVGTHSLQNEMEKEVNDGTLESEEEDQPSIAKRLSSKKYQEDEKRIMESTIEHSNYLQVPKGKDEQRNLDHGLHSGEEVNNEKKKSRKKVTIQETTNVKRESTDQKRIIHQPHCMHGCQNSSLMVLSPEGGLLVYYVTNLILLSKYDEASKTIENFGMKITNDQLCHANLLKLQAYILSLNSDNYKETQLKYEVSSKTFSHLKIYHGQALCSCAIGLLMYSNPVAFITKAMNETKVFEKAKQKFEEAANLYQKVNHFVGEAFCHKILSFIKKKLGENSMDNQRKMKNLMMKDSILQKEGKSNFIHVNGGRVEVSLILEVIQQQQDQVAFSTRENVFSLKNQKAKDNCQCTSSSRPQKKEHADLKHDEMRQSSYLLNQKKLIEQPSTSKEPKKSRKVTSKYNTEFDKLKLQLEKKNKVQTTNEEIKEQPKSGKVSNEINQRRGRQPPSNTKILTSSMNSMNSKHIPFKHNEKNEENVQDQFISSDGEVNMIQAQAHIKEEKKRHNDLQSQAKQQIEKYKNTRNEMIEKAKNQLSSSFVQPRHSQAPDMMVQKPQRESGNQPAINSKLKKLSMLKKLGQDMMSSQASTIQKESEENFQTNYTLFDLAPEMQSQKNISDEDDPSFLERSSFLGPTKSNPTDKNLTKKSSQQSLIPSRNSGRVSARPSLAQSHQMQQDKQPQQTNHSKRSTMGTSQGKKANEHKPKQIEVPKTPSDLHTTRHSSPNTLTKGKVLNQQQHLQQQQMPSILTQQQQPTSVQQTTTTTTNLGGNQMVQLAITTTTTVKIEVPQQLLNSNQPQIVVEEVDKIGE